MKNDVFITGTSCFFPNEPILNEDMEDFWFIRHFA